MTTFTSVDKGRSHLGACMLSLPASVLGNWVPVANRMHYFNISVLIIQRLSFQRVQQPCVIMYTHIYSEGVALKIKSWLKFLGKLHTSQITQKNPLNIACRCTREPPSVSSCLCLNASNCSSETSANADHVTPGTQCSVLWVLSNSTA